MGKGYNFTGTDILFVTALTRFIFAVSQFEFLHFFFPHLANQICFHIFVFLYCSLQGSIGLSRSIYIIYMLGSSTLSLGVLSRIDLQFSLLKGSATLSLFHAAAIVRSMFVVLTVITMLTLCRGRERAPSLVGIRPR